MGRGISLCLFRLSRYNLQEKGGIFVSTYVISDIHGQYQAYLDILEEIGFSNFTENDHLYILGDVIDRGYDSVHLLLDIMKHRDKITLLMGNHELMMLESFPYEDISRTEPHASRLWCVNGGDSTYDDFIYLTPQEQRSILDFLSELPYCKTLSIQGKSYYLVHGMPFDCEDYGGSHHIREFSQKKRMVWGKFRSYEDKNTTVVFGHCCTELYDPRFQKGGSPPPHYEIYHEDNFIAIDCGCAYQSSLSRLGCLCLEDFSTFYSKVDCPKSLLE